MDRNSLRALITGLLLVPLAWIVIALTLKQHARPGHVPAVVIWGVLFLVDLAVAAYSVLHMQRVRAHGHRG